MDINKYLFFENCHIITYVKTKVNCQMRFTDILTPNFTDDSDETGKHRGNFLSLEELKMSDATSKNVSYAPLKQTVISY